MELNKSFTLVLLIKGRHDFTYRWLVYMNKINFKYPIFIGDGQDDDETIKMIKKINVNKNLDISYYRYNTHSSYLEYYKMKNDILSKVKTKFVMLCDNDDFILPSGLKDQINFLSENNDYISASGRILNFEIDGYDYVCYGQKPTFLEPCSYYRLEEPLNNWQKQIRSVFTKFQPNFYNVFHTKELKIISDELIELNFSDLVINEFYIQLRASTLGKSKILSSSFHYLRQRGTSSISKNYEFSKDILKKNMPEDVRKMANKISEILNLNENEIDIKNDIFSSFADYLNFFLANTTLKYRFPKIYNFKILLINFLKSYLSNLYRFYKSLKNYLILKKINKHSKISNNRTIKELEDIYNFLKKNN